MKPYFPVICLTFSATFGAAFSALALEDVRPATADAVKTPGFELSEDNGIDINPEGGIVGDALKEALRGATQGTGNSGGGHTGAPGDVNGAIEGAIDVLPEVLGAEGELTIQEALAVEPFHPTLMRFAIKNTDADAGIKETAEALVKFAEENPEQIELVKEKMLSLFEE